MCPCIVFRIRVLYGFMFIYLSIYIYIYIYIIGSETMGAQEERAPTSFIMRGGHKFSNWTLKENL